MSETIEQKCIAKGVKLTDQRKIIDLFNKGLLNKNLIKPKY